MRRFSIFLLTAIFPLTALLFGLLLVSCNDDEPPLGDYRRELAEVITDGKGQPTTLILDDGRHYSVSNSIDNPATPDTTYRCMVTHLPDTDNHTTYLAFTDPVGSQLPIYEYSDLLTKLGSDPLKLLSVWRVNRYINLRVDILTSGLPHSIGYLWDGLDVEGHHYSAAELRARFGEEATIRQMRDGLSGDAGHPVTLVMRLLHSEGQNSHYYTRSTYLSLPVYPFEQILVARRDSVALLIPTTDGEQRFVNQY